ncbi:MAG: hypothetical protein J6Q11_06555 [Fibrobacteraceae bacterium]|jgi:hypothetical protein|nr:hypothetical protein [Fibrobacteraceae bacterium]MBQ5611511.1 hypothetical protein [Fibrobacteraceae bacterium]
MSRSERRRAKRKAQNFVPKKSRQIDKRILILLAVVAVVFFVGSTLLKYSA